MKHLLIALLLVAGILPMKADNITVDGTSRSYIVYAPKNLGEKRPLFIFCHGAGQDANYMLNTQFRDASKPVSIEAVCDTAKFVMVFPNGINNQWDIGGNRDINFVKALIDKMAKQYDIDRNRVYLGGFSMGGMFTYHAMNKIPDLIAAFVPVSGYPMGGATANASVRPLPIMHIHGTADDVCGFSGVQPALNVWIKHNGCPTTAKVVNNYNGFKGAKLHTWAPGNDGVEVKLLELPDKGHWVCKEPQVYTGKEMWNFCKIYSLNKTTPNVSITAPAVGTAYTIFAPLGEATFPAVTIKAEADDPNGTVAKVDFYDGTNLIATCTSKPYKVTLDHPTSGKHTLKAVATDNDGETATATIDVAFNAPQTQYSLSQFFIEAGSIPAGWVTNDGNEQRIGVSSGYTLGCRVLQFTGTRRSFNYGLYFRNVEGKTRAGNAKYGQAKSGTTLTLHPGKYTLKYKICNWNKPEFSPVDICIERSSDGKAVASQSYTPNVNIGNVVSNSFSTVTQQTFDFEITEKDEYLLAFYTDDVEWGDCVIGHLMLTINEFTPVVVEDVKGESLSANPSSVYDMSGRLVSTSPQQWRSGQLLLISKDGKDTKKVYVR